ncbi:MULTISPECIES: AMP phosphorylase [unclassified Archaeoglobus]|jgi:AMP phosphorylase|uniref:AMP phosphorylase n=1 Tax=unclassified Archaeoglobus TaxID=2643606 RepID=UPI0025BE911B|nr:MULTISPECIES: AMP phosphorylase [unclassified Archaeoglobus]
MKFKAKILPLRTERVAVVLSQDDAAELGLLPGDRVRVSLDRRSFVAEVEIASEFVDQGEVGVCSFTAETCSIEEECVVEIVPFARPKSVEYIRKKFDGGRYERVEIGQIIKDISDGILSDVEMAAFILANEIVGMSDDEVQWMVEAMVENGERVSFDRGGVVDTHSIGGVPGNRYSMITVPTVAAAGLLIPKTASRAITSASGTADTMEVLADVNLSVDEIKEITERVGGVIAWNAAAGIAPADEQIIRVEYQLEISPKPHLMASLMAKKVGGGAKFIAIDIPIGRGAKIENIDLGRSFASSFMEIGRKLNLKVAATLSDGSQPLGNAIGPALEAKEVLNAMEKKKGGDLVEKAIGIAGILFEMTGVATNGYMHARKIFESGKTLEKFREIVAAQGGDENVGADDIPVGDKVYTLEAVKDGYVREVDIAVINEIARTAGAPKDKGAGVYVHKKRGEVVNAGDPLLTIYAEKDWKLDNAIEVANTKQSFDISGVIIEKLSYGRWWP